MLAVGDLVFLKMNENKKIMRTGLIVKIQHVTKIETTPFPIDAKVLWLDGETSWCLGEALTILSSIKNKQ